MERLEHEADALRAQARAAVLIQLREIRAGEPDLAGGGRIKSGEQCEQRRFAGARGADDRHRLARRDLERHGTNNGQQTFRAANLLGEVFSLENTFEMFRAPGRSCVCWWLIAFSDAAAASDRTVLVLGDSLSAGYGLKPAQGWVALLEKRLRTKGTGTAS